jgi:hypothetical protein
MLRIAEAIRPLLASGERLSHLPWPGQIAGG